MSGLEIVGVVLGAFPLLLAVLDKLEVSVKTAKTFLKVRREFSKCKRDIRYHELRFQTNLKKLLLPLALKNESIAKLLKDSSTEAWKEGDVAARLQNRLADSLKLYVELMSDFRRTLDDLKDELAMDNNEIQRKLASQGTESLPPAPMNSYRPHRQLKSALASCEFELYRIAFSLPSARANRNELFEELDTLNTRLGTLVGEQDEIQELETARANQQHLTKSLLGPKAESFWQAAEHLYKSLAKAWRCPCVHYHCANLMLQHRRDLDLDFMLVFQFQRACASKNSSSHSWQMREARIKGLLEEATTAIVIQPPIQATSQPTHRTAAPLRSALRMGNGKRRAQIRLPSDLQAPRSSPVTSSRTTVFTVTKTAQNVILETQTEKAIQSLCHTFASQCSTTCLGFVEHEDTRYYFYPSQDRTQVDKAEPTTLNQLLLAKDGPRLTRGQKYTLALTLASAFLQLRGSAWMSSALTKSDIKFMRDGLNPNVLRLDEPFLTKDFALVVYDCSKQDNAVDHIIMLGIVMVELCLGAPLSTSPKREKYPSIDKQADAVFDMVAATEICKDLGGDEDEGYLQAVNWCLGSKGLVKDGAWRRDFCSHVIAPLDLACQHYKASRELFQP